MKLSKYVVNETESERALQELETMSSNLQGLLDGCCHTGGSWVCRVLGKGPRALPELALSVRTDFFLQSLAARTPL